MELRKNNHLICFISALFFLPGFWQAQVTIKDYSAVLTGAQQFELYVPKLKNKRVAVVTNMTGLVGKTSIVDTLISLKVNVRKIFAPEHGFRGDVDAGGHVDDEKDSKTGLPIVSLHGKSKKPSSEQLVDVDVLIYDIQDLGVRFYTYISTMTYVMEACAENRKDLIVLDRPNPNGFYIDGPVLKDEFKSFLGLHPVPIVYGMTTGEYAKMVNGQTWLKNKVRCKLTVIPLKNYDRNASYRLTVSPSPNIPNEQAVLLYPGLGLFEGSVMSLGRGTEFPFQVIGHPSYPDKAFSFTPKPTALSKDPKHVKKLCYGVDLRKDDYLSHHPKQIDLARVILTYRTMRMAYFFDSNFNFHSGNGQLQEQIESNIPESEIRKTWQAEIESFKKIRKKYLLYPDLAP